MESYSLYIHNQNTFSIKLLIYSGFVEELIGKKVLERNGWKNVVKTNESLETVKLQYNGIDLYGELDGEQIQIDIKKENKSQKSLRLGYVRNKDIWFGTITTLVNNVSLVLCKYSDIPQQLINNGKISTIDFIKHARLAYKVDNDLVEFLNSAYEGFTKNLNESGYSTTMGLQSLIGLSLTALESMNLQNALNSIGLNGEVKVVDMLEPRVIWPVENTM